MRDVQWFLAGDSTVCDYDSDRAPRAGWGQKIGAFLSDGVLIGNEAASGRSSKSFIEEGRLERIMTQIRSGDYLFVQFGHNDQKPDDRYTEPFTTYKQHLRRYIDDARLKKPIRSSLHRSREDHLKATAGSKIPTATILMR